MIPNFITVIIADDHEFFREGVITMLNKSCDIKVVAEASNGHQLVQLAEKHLPNVILTDIKMPGMNGIEATSIITKKLPDIAVIALSMMDNSFTIADMMHAGAIGYLLKDAPKDKVIEGIRAVNKNKEYFCSGASQKLAAALSSNSSIQHDPSKRSFKNLRFTEIEKEITTLICNGLSSSEIAKKIYRSVKTIENYRARLLQKTGCKNIAEFAFFVAQNNLYNT